jgi:hypothetical protein
MHIYKYLQHIVSLFTVMELTVVLEICQELAQSLLQAGLEFLAHLLTLETSGAQFPFKLQLQTRTTVSINLHPALNNIQYQLPREHSPQ